MNKEPKPVPLNDIGSCGRGALYFTDAENLKGFLSYGTHLAWVTPGKYVMDSDGNKWKSHRLTITRLEKITWSILLNIPDIDVWNILRRGVVNGESLPNNFLKIITNRKNYIIALFYLLVYGKRRDMENAIQVLKKLSPIDINRAKAILKEEERVPNMTDEVVKYELFHLMVLNAEYVSALLDERKYKEIQKLMKKYGTERILKIIRNLT